MANAAAQWCTCDPTPGTTNLETAEQGRAHTSDDGDTYILVKTEHLPLLRAGARRVGGAEHHRVDGPVLGAIDRPSSSGVDGLHGCVISNATHRPGSRSSCARARGQARNNYVAIKQGTDNLTGGSPSTERKPPPSRPRRASRAGKPDKPAVAKPNTQAGRAGQQPDRRGVAAKEEPQTQEAGPEGRRTREAGRRQHGVMCLGHGGQAGLCFGDSLTWGWIPVARCADRPIHPRPALDEGFG